MQTSNLVQLDFYRGNTVTANMQLECIECAGAVMCTNMAGSLHQLYKHKDATVTAECEQIATPFQCPSPLCCSTQPDGLV